MDLQEASLVWFVLIFRKMSFYLALWTLGCRQGVREMIGRWGQVWGNEELRLLRMAGLLEGWGISPWRQETKTLRDGAPNGWGTVRSCCSAARLRRRAPAC